MSNYFGSNPASVPLSVNQLVAQGVVGTGPDQIPRNNNLGTASVANVGTGANQVVQLDGTGSLPAVNASNLLNTVPAGAIFWFARNTAPDGYIKANGAAVSRSTYAALFSAIGTTFGVGDGSTTFALPDMRGEFPRGWDDGRAVDSGRVFGSAQAQAIQSHTHTVNSGSGQINDFGGNLATTNNFVTAAATSAAGGTETRPRNIALLACIKF